MKARDIMTVGVATVRPDTTLEHAAHEMIQHGVSGLPVVNDTGRILGIVTERDLLHRPELGTEHRRPRWLEFWTSPTRRAEEYAREHGRKVEDVMSHEVVSVSPEAELGEVADLLERGGFKRLPVVENGKVVGIIGRANLVLALSRRMGDVPQAAADDITIRRSILDELKKRDWAPIGTLDIVVRDGVVELKGTVTDVHVRDAVRVAAENAPGVVRVWDKLEVVPPPVGYI